MRTKKASDAKVTLDLNFDGNEIQNAIVERAAQLLVAHNENALRIALSQEISKTSSEMIKARLSDELRKLLAEGWQQTDNYGCARGERVTLNARIAEFLNHKNGNYGSDPKWADGVIAKCVDESFRGELGKVIAEVTARVKAMLDDEILKRVAAAIKAGMGIK